MSVLTAKATCKYAVESSSSWSSYAYQGYYSGTSASNNRVGHIALPTLSNVDWKRQKVSSIQFKMVFTSSGASAQKTLYWFKSNRASAGGRGSDIVGDALGSCTTNGTAYGTTRTITITGALLDAMVAYLSEGGTAFCLYKKDSTNYLGITSCTVTVEYDIAGSVFSLDESSYNVGDTVGVTIDPISTEGTLTHTATLNLGTQTLTQTLASGTTSASFAIPLSWHTEISGMSRAATVSLATIVDGEEIGTLDASVDVTIPDTWSPYLTGVKVARYETIVDETTTRKESPIGYKVWVSMNMLAGYYNATYNKPQVVITFERDDGGQTGTYTINYSGTSRTITNNIAIFKQTIDTGHAYTFTFTTSNGHSTEVQTVVVGKARANLHIAGSDYGVGIGMYSTGTAENPSLDVAYPVNAYAGMGVVSTVSDRHVREMWLRFDGQTFDSADERSITLGTISLSGITDIAGIDGAVAAYTDDTTVEYMSVNRWYSTSAFFEAWITADGTVRARTRGFVSVGYVYLRVLYV